jgi:predicted exporter
MKGANLRWPFVVLIILAAVGMSMISKTRLAIDMDITKSLPLTDPVIADSQYVMMHHPVKDRIVIDLSQDKGDVDTLIEGASFIEDKLAASGFFKSVGMKEYQNLFPELVSHIVASMPALFTEQELEEDVKPLIEGEAIRKRVAENYSQLLNLEGIGQARMITEDPLGFRNIIFARMAPLAPSTSARISRGHLISNDGRHLLIIAEPRGSATDTALARKIVTLTKQCESGLEEKFKPRGIGSKLTLVGAYRAALDNEEMAIKDTRRALIFATLGIALLLLAGFPRPFIGILALVPAVLGAVAASFVYSLFTGTISILAIGFGATIISFTVDYGIAYLLFLDRPYETHGVEATKEVWGLSLLAMLTTAVSFASLFISGFPALAEIGYFTALGVMFTYVFVHTLFPVIFPTLPPAKREGFVPLRNFVNKMMGSGPGYKFYAALAFCAFMLIFARPDFRVDLSSMNTVSRDTLAAEKLVTTVWGNVLSRLYLMTEARSVDELQQEGDLLAEVLAKEKAASVLSTAFVPSMIFPGRERMKKNLSAWKRFWTPARVAVLKDRMREASAETGFAPDAFEPFYKTLSVDHMPYTDIPEQFYALFGIQKMADKGSWAQFSVLTPGPKYNAERFYSRISSSGLAKLFDPTFFGERLGSIIMAGFIKMALIVGAVTIVVALLYLLDIRLTLIAMAPTLFSLVCTFGTMKLLHQQPGIPAIIVTVIVIGMGTDYAIYLVRAYQRYMDEFHPSVGLIRMTVSLSAASTMIGFGVLSLADHALLRNAGFTLLLGIGYSFAGTVLIVPPMLRRVFVPGVFPDREVESRPGEYVSRVRRRYSRMEPYPRFFARFKMLFDPMFRELPRFLESYHGIRTIIDIGSGYGLPACWLLERFPESKVYGIDPDPDRVRVASMAAGNRGFINRGRAPDVPTAPEPADLALMLDSVHYLKDNELRLTLESLGHGLSQGGTLMLRMTIRPERRFPWLWWLENFKLRIHRVPCYYRSVDQIAEMLVRSGFGIELTAPSGSRGELVWVIARTRS